jgi:acetylornithine deacetylase/succinyl-diaminopimelate desuccinylase-like protein
MTRTVRINRDRLWAPLMESRQIGAYDEATWLRGVRRLALTDADAEARRCCRVRFGTDMLGSAVTAARHGVQIAWERTAKTAVVSFHPGIQDLLVATADDLGLPYARTMSGARNDAQEISAICRCATVFVAGENGGISHTPGEYSNPDACANGTEVLANAVLRRAEQP